MGPINPNISIVSGNMTSNNYGGNLANFTGIIDAVNAELALIDSSGNFSRLYIDGSLATRDASIAWLMVQTSGEVTKAYVDGSIAVFATNVSIGTAAFAKNASLALYVQIPLDYNTAHGKSALSIDPITHANTAIGYYALANTSTGISNTGVGYFALTSDTDGANNVAVGHSALYSNAIGDRNVALGQAALLNLASGDDNIAIGSDAGSIVVSTAANASSNQSIFIGYVSKPLAINGVNEIVIGHAAAGAGSNTVTLGNNSVTKTVLKGTIDVTNNKIVNLASPADASDGVNKFYADASLGLRIRFVPGAGAGLRDGSTNLAIYDFTYVDTSAYLKIAPTGANCYAQWKFETTALA